MANYDSSTFIRSVAVSSASKAGEVTTSRQFIGLTDSTTEVYKTSDGSLETTLTPFGNHTDRIYDIDVSDGEGYVAIGANNGNNGLAWYDLADLSSPANTLSTSTAVRGVSWSSDESLIATAQDDSEFIVYKRSDGSQDGSLSSGIGFAADVAFDPQGTYAVVTDDYTGGTDAYHVIDTSNYSKTRTHITDGVGRFCEWIGGNGEFYIATRNGHIEIFDRSDGSLVKDFALSDVGGNTAKPREIASAPNGSWWAVSRTEADTIEIYEVGASDGTGWNKLDTLDQSVDPDGIAWDTDSKNFHATVTGDGGYLWETTAVTLTVNTKSESNLGFSTVTLNGELTELSSNTDVYFEWRQTGASSWNTTPTQTLSSTGTFSEDLTNLDPETEYEFRAQADDGTNTDTGSTLTFTTKGLFDEWTPRMTSTKSDWDVVSKTSNFDGAVLEADPGTADRHGLSYDPADGSGDVEALALTRPTFDSSLERMSLSRIYLRGQKTDPESVYFCQFVYKGWADNPSYYFQLQKYSGSDTISLDETEINDPTGKWWWIRFDLTGDELQARFWEYETPEKDFWDVSITDSEISSSGYVGLGTYQTILCEWDYFDYATGDGSPIIGESIETLEPDTVTSNSATLKGQVNSLGTYDEVTVDFLWKRKNADSFNNTGNQTLTEPGEFEWTISDLGSAEYVYRARGTFGDSTVVEGGDVTFTTGEPYVTTVAPVIPNIRAESGSGQGWRLYREGVNPIRILNVNEEIRSYDTLDLTFRVNQLQVDRIKSICAQSGKFEEVSTPDGGFKMIDTAEGNNTISMFPPSSRSTLRSITEWIVREFSTEVVDQELNEYEGKLSISPLHPKSIRAGISYPNESAGTAEWLFDFVNRDIAFATSRVTADITSIETEYSVSYELSLFLTELEAIALEDALQKLDGVVKDDVLNDASDIVDTTANNYNTIDVTSPSNSDGFSDGRYIVTSWETEWINDEFHRVTLEIAQ